MLDRSFVFMGHSRDHIDPADTPDDDRFQLVFPGDEISVRSALHSATGAMRNMALGAQMEGVVEIVLAEVLNNVVEHAYSNTRPGVIEIVVDRQDDALAFSVTDDGQPMPEGTIPAGQRHDLDVSPEHLPEGGFGWFLIRALTEDLSYSRTAARNRLMFRIPFNLAARPN